MYVQFVILVIQSNLANWGRKEEDASSMYYRDRVDVNFSLFRTSELPLMWFPKKSINSLARKSEHEAILTWQFVFHRLQGFFTMGTFPLLRLVPRVLSKGGTERKKGPGDYFLLDHLVTRLFSSYLPVGRHGRILIVYRYNSEHHNETFLLSLLRFTVLS